MDKIKTVLILIAIIIGGFGVLAAIGFIYALLGYVLIFSFLAVAGYIAFRVLSNKNPRELEASAPERQLQKVERTLEEYKRKLN